MGELFEAALYLGVGGETNEKYLLFDFAQYVLFLAQFTRWLLTSRLRIFKDKRRNFETRPSPLSKVGENAFGAPFLQLLDYLPQKR